MTAEQEEMELLEYSIISLAYKIIARQYTSFLQPTFSSSINVIWSWTNTPNYNGEVYLIVLY